METNPYQAPLKPSKRLGRLRYRLHTLRKWLRDNDRLRVQITLVLGFLGLGAAYALWLEYKFNGNVPLPVCVVAALVGFASLVAIAEGVWKVDD
jgi:hypothetical protein